jgi:ATP-dependent DNA helicase PIF1
MATKVVYVRADVGVVEIVVLILLALIVVYCMLGGGYSATGLLRGWIGRRTIARAAAAAAHHRQQLQAQAQAQAQARAHSVAIARSHLNPRSFSSHDDRLHSRNMLGAAVKKHNASTDASRPVNQLFSSSPPLQQQSQKSSILHTTSKDTKSTNGIKRTHSGLAKTFGHTASFDDEQTQPVVCAVPEVTNSEYFDADDFDDDFDLDDLMVEEPKFKRPTPKASIKTENIISYPTLPKFTASPHSAFHPTLPRRQVRDFKTPVDSGYATGPPSQEQLKQEDFGSSAPLPWSSSPTEHLKPSFNASALHRFAYNNSNGPAASRAQPTSAPVKTEHVKIEQVKTEPTAASKRRTLPWLKEETSQLESKLHSLPPSKKRVVDATPIQTSKKSALPWNTTASAIKEQKTSLREINKKKSKFNEPSDEVIQKAKVKNRKNMVARVFLSDEQQHILDLISEKKKSVFFTGAAGTGKSVLLRESIATLRKKYLREPDRVAVTASTGLAACNIGGVTLHSFAGIGLGKEDVPELVKKIKRNQKAKHRWMRTKVLVVDEISMVDGDLFDKLEAIARQIRNNGRPFGGIQLVITGDFFQLPPVPDSGKIAKFAFDAATWSTSIEYTIGLHHVFRQKDPVFANMLNEMREGRMSAESIKTFHTLSRPLESESSIDATELFPTRNEVENANQSKMSQLVGELRTFDARDGGSITDKGFRDKLLANCMAPETVTLKKGAQVMLIKNIDESLVNGSLGKIIGFMNETQFDSYNNNEEAFMATQGGTLKDEDATRDKKNTARERLLENMLGNTSMIFPVVRFTLADGTTRDLLCQRENWKIELPDGEVQASRSQIPLILAWALSIHKAQGQTLERVKVDLGKVFEKGQAYVALSRATSMQGLQVLRFDPRKVVAHEKVRTFYQNLSRVEGLEQNKPKVERGKNASRGNGFTASEYERDFSNGRM